MSGSSTNVNLVNGIMGKVYGETDEKSDFSPKPYKDNKSRYLWTDAFGVCNYITLFYETNDEIFLKQADALIDGVHNTLGKDRKGKNRLGASTDDHPLLGGLRIGKPDEEGTRDGDGQYFHYLTKWMFALNRMSIARSEPKYNDWAIELAKAIHPHFVYERDSPRPRMFWKITIDMSEPAVMSEGNLDPFDGYVTYRIISDCSNDKDVLKDEISDLKKIVDRKYSNYFSQDALDLGEALWIAHWFPTEVWAKTISDISLASLSSLWQNGYFSSSNSRYRLGFREFGTTIGLQVTPAEKPEEWNQRVQSLHQFWGKTENLYRRDYDISPVMFCTSLIPGVFQKDRYN